MRVNPNGAAVIACAILVQACSGFTVTPTSPTTSTPPPTGSPVTITVRGTLADGGSFEGWITYGTRDQDPREDFGRYNGGFWDVVVKGGTATRDVHFSHAAGGRALVETYNSPFPAIGIVFLWPASDPATQALTPHVRPMQGYDPDVQPTLRDFGPLVPGSLSTFGVFQDGQGGRAVITSIELQ